MNWDAIGAVGQLLGAMVLLLVLLQVRHARDEMRRSISQSRSDGIRDLFIATRVSNERVNSLHVKVAQALGNAPSPFVTALVERAGTTIDEAHMLQWEQMAWWQNQVQSVRNVSQLTEAERISMEQAIRRTYRGNTLPAIWYETMKATLNAGAVRYVDNLLAQPR